MEAKPCMPSGSATSSSSTEPMICRRCRILHAAPASRLVMGALKVGPWHGPNNMVQSGLQGRAEEDELVLHRQQQDQQVIHQTACGSRALYTECCHKCIVVISHNRHAPHEEALWSMRDAHALSHTGATPVSVPYVQHLSSCTLSPISCASSAGTHHLRLPTSAHRGDAGWCA
jgi:hypothetical protein